MTTSPSVAPGMCPRHPEEKATKTCGRCRTAYCYLCARTVGSEVVCIRCRLAEPAPASPPLAALGAGFLLLIAGIAMYLLRGDRPGYGDEGSLPAATAIDATAPVASPGGLPVPPAPEAYAAAPPVPTPPEGPQRYVDKEVGIELELPAGCTVERRTEGPTRYFGVREGERPIMMVVVITLYPWMPPEESAGARQWTEGARAHPAPLPFEVPFEGTSWSYRPDPPELVLRGADRFVFFHSAAPWVQGTAEAALLASFRWIPLPPPLERAAARHGLSPEEGALPTTPEERQKLGELAARIRKLGALPSPVLRAVNWAERPEMTRAELLLVRDFLREVLAFVGQAAEEHR